MGIGNIYRLKTNYPASKVLLTATTGTYTYVTSTSNNTVISSLVGDYKSAIFFTSVVSNTTGAPKIYLDGSYNGTNYTVYATLHSDLTTTANTKVVGVDPLPAFCRLRVRGSTTAGTVSVQIRACLRP